MILNATAQAIPLRDGSVHCVVTSPPYWGLRDYGVPPSIWGGDEECPHDWGESIPGNNRGGSGTPTDKNNRGEGYGRAVARGTICTICGAWRGCLGLEPTPESYVEHLVAVFREVKRVLREDGTLWLNLGDCYASQGGAPGGGYDGGILASPGREDEAGTRRRNRSGGIAGLKPKDLVGIPWRVAFALQADGWYLRSDIIWSKPNPMPESVTDRPTKAHEHLFLLAKRDRYYYDGEAIKERAANGERFHGDYADMSILRGQVCNRNGRADSDNTTTHRNRRSVWTIPTEPYAEAHFATMPTELVKPCVLAGTSERGVCSVCGAPWARIVERASVNRSNAAKAGTTIEGKGHVSSQVHDGHDVRNGPTTSNRTTGWQPTCLCGGPAGEAPLVLDPFAGSGTVGEVCHAYGRRFIGLDLNLKYCRLGFTRTAQLGLV